MGEKKVSKLAISSIILSAASIFFWGSCWVSWIPGVICGHIALAKIKVNPNLKGKNIALISLAIGYLFPLALFGVVLYLSGYLERQVTVIDHGRIIWEGSYPYGSVIKGPQNTSDSILTSVTLDGKTVGTIESRDNKLRLVLKLNSSGKELTIWEYQDYGSVSRVTVDGVNSTLSIYYDRTFIRSKQYITVVSLTDSKIHGYLVDRGKWCL